MLAALLIGIVVLFQIALLLGAPWGEAAWGGGRKGRLPVRLRIASGVSALLLVALAWVVLAAARLIAATPLPASLLGAAIWVVTGYFVLGTVANAISRSPRERLWAPVSLAVSVCCGIVAVV